VSQSSDLLSHVDKQEKELTESSITLVGFDSLPELSLTNYGGIETTSDEPLREM